jgi:hypothetical protein
MKEKYRERLADGGRQGVLPWQNIEGCGRIKDNG